jgi:ABC-2 type transport system ATP-binding protein
MKQLVKLAQAIVHAPKLLFLDEPTNGLDPPARLRMIHLIREIRDEGQVRMILSSHLLRDVEECCEEVVILKDGNLVVYCNLEEERRANRKFLEIETRGDDGSFAEAVGKLGCEYALQPNRRKIKVVLPPDVDVRHLYQAAEERHVQIRRLDYRRDSLQDIFMKAMEKTNGGV